MTIRRKKGLERKDRRPQQRTPTPGEGGGNSVVSPRLWPLLGGGGRRRTSQEGEAGEGPAAETEISNKWSRDATEISNRVEQGNPSWVQL